MEVESTNSLLRQLIPSVNVEARRQLEALFSRLDGVHGSLQMKFRAVYATYQANPCAEGADEHLRKAIERIEGSELHFREIQKDILQQIDPGVKESKAIAGDARPPTPDEVAVGVPFGVHYVRRDFLKSMRIDELRIETHVENLETVQLR